ncbi:MAG: thioredoxin-disulfide reductase [Pseudomonadota bacterium]
MSTQHSKVLILGSGPAGATAAIYAARANLEPTMVTGMQPGGQLTITTDVENFPGFTDPIQGPWLMQQMEGQAKNVGTNIINDHVVEVNFKSKPFTATGQSGAVYSGDTIIISTGAQAKWLGLDSEQHFQGYGVSGCATCDGFFFKDKNVLVVGGGNTAVEEALFLTKFASKVTLIHRRDELRAEKIMQKRLFANDKVEVLWHTELKEIIGDNSPRNVTGVKLYNNKEDKTTEIPMDGVFIAIGHKPNTELFKKFLKLDSEGYIITQPDSTATSVRGVYASGDVQDKIYRQAVTAAGTGCMAALEAEKLLAE